MPRSCVFLLVVLSGALAGQQDLKSTMQRAVEAFQAGLFYEAEEAFLAVERTHPQNTDVVHGLAMCTARTKRYDPSLAYFKRLVALPKPKAQFFNNYASTLEEMGKADEARPLFLRALELDAKFTNSWFALGRIASRQGDAAEARMRLAKALAIDEKHVDAHYELAEVAFREGKLDEAEKLVKRTLGLAPRHVGARFLLARITLKSGKKEDGARLLAEAKELQKSEDRRATVSRNVASYLDVAWAARRQGRIGEAIGTFGEALKLDPAGVPARNALTTLEQELRQAGRNAEADSCRRLLDGTP